MMDWIKRSLTETEFDAELRRLQNDNRRADLKRAIDDAVKAFHRAVEANPQMTWEEFIRQLSNARERAEEQQMTSAIKSLQDKGFQVIEDDNLSEGTIVFHQRRAPQY